MSLPGYVPGMPGIKTAYAATHRIVIRQDLPCDFALGKVIDGSKSRDSSNTGDLDVLRPGTLMGKITSSGKYAPSILGVLQGAKSATDTSVTVTAAQATEIVRRVGSTGTLRFVGPPSAAGTVATFTETYSAVDTATGIITCSGLDADLIAGSFVCANDGTYLPLTFISDGYGIKVTDVFSSTSIDVPFAQMPVLATVITANLLPVWPSDTSLQAWIFEKLNLFGKFIPDYGF